MPDYDDDQFLALLGQQNITGQEHDLARQAALANQLRQGATGGRMDWASQLGRGLTGIAGGYMTGQLGEKEKALGQSRQSVIDAFRRKRTAGIDPGALVS